MRGLSRKPPTRRNSLPPSDPQRLTSSFPTSEHHPQTRLRLPCRVQERLRPLQGGGEDPRRRLQEMGLLFPVSHPRPRRRDGYEAVHPPLVRLLRRHHRYRHRLRLGLFHPGGHLPDGCAGKAREHLHRAGFLPDHVRAHDPFLRFHGALRSAGPHAAAALQPPAFRQPAVPPRHG